MKLNNIINKAIILPAFCISSLFITSSCNEDESLEREGKPVVSIEQKNITTTEGFGVALKFDFSYVIKEEAQFRIEVVGGTAEEGVDYNFNLDTIEDAGFGYFGGEGYFAEVPSFQRSFVLSDILTLVEDGVNDPNETIILKISSVSKGTILINETVTITTEELVPTTLDVTLDYQGSITIDGNSFNKCDLDFDILLNDDVSAAYNGNVYYNYAGCTESISGGNAGGPLNNDANDWADGTIYQVWVDYWSSNGNLPAAITTHENIPVDITFTKVLDGATTTNLTLTFNSIYNTNDTTSEDDPSEEIGNRNVASVEIVGNNYIITNKITGEVTVF